MIVILFLLCKLFINSLREDFIKFNWFVFYIELEMLIRKIRLDVGRLFVGIFLVFSLIWIRW